MAETMFDFIGATPNTPDMSGAIEYTNEAEMYKQLMDTVNNAAKLGTAVFTDIATQNASLAKQKEAEDKAYNDLIERSRADEYNRQVEQKLGVATTANEFATIYKNERTQLEEQITNKTISDTYAKTLLTHLNKHAQTTADILVKDHEEQGAKALVTDAKIVLAAGGNVPEAINAFSTLYKIQPAKLQQTFLGAYTSLVSEGYSTLLMNPNTTLQQVKEYDSTINTIKSGLNNNYFFGSSSQDMQKYITDAENVIADKKKEAISFITNKYQGIINAYEGDGKGRGAYTGDWKAVRDTVQKLHYDNTDQMGNTLRTLKDKTEQFDEARRIDSMDSINPYAQALKASNTIVAGWLKEEVSKEAIIALATENYTKYNEVIGKNSLLVGPIMKDTAQAMWASQDENVIKQSVAAVSNQLKTQGGYTIAVLSLGESYAQKFATLDVLNKAGIYGRKTRDGRDITNILDLKNAMSSIEASAAKSGLSQDEYASIDNAKLGPNKQHAIYALQMTKTLTDLTPDLRESIIEQFSKDQKTEYYDTPIFGKVYEVNRGVKDLVEDGLNNMRKKWADTMGVPLSDVTFVAKDNKHIQLNVGGVEQSTIIDISKYESLMQDYQRKIGGNQNKTLQGIEYVTDVVGSHTKTFVDMFSFGHNKDVIAIRAFNPLNLRPSDRAAFRGKVGVEKTTSGEFIKFDSPQSGLRAAFINVHNGSKGHTLSSFISKFAPKADNNDTVAYINSISKYTGITPNSSIPKEKIYKVVEGMIIQEGGRDSLNFYRPFMKQSYHMASQSFK